MEIAFHEELKLRYAQKLIEKYPDFAFLYDNASYAYHRLNENSIAIEYLKKAVELEPDNHNFLSDFGFCYSCEQDFENAALYLKKSLDLGNYNENIIYNLKEFEEMKEKNLSFKELYLLPIDMDTVNKYSGNAEFEELDNYIDLVNSRKMHILSLNFAEKGQKIEHNYSEIFKTLRIFFRFVESISDEYFIHEDIKYQLVNFKTIIRMLILKFNDLDDDVLNEIYEGLLLYYGFFLENEVIDKEDFEKFKEEILSM